jgi:hypothetical protein
LAKRNEQRDDHGQQNKGTHAGFPWRAKIQWLWLKWPMNRMDKYCSKMKRPVKNVRKKIS